jgi:CheY-like chemotaxis protein
VTQIRFLLLDPDPKVQEAAAALASRGHTVIGVADMQDALRRAATHAADVIVLSPDLPGLDLPAFVRTLRTLPATALTPILFLSAKAPVEGRLQGYLLGSDDFLPKPVEPREMELRLAVAKRLRDKAETTFKPKPADSGDFSSAAVLTAFKGSLDQIGLPSLLSLIDMERKTGVLVVVLEPGKEKLRIFFSDGRVMRAAFDKRDKPKNAELLYGILGSNQGRFEFRNQPVEIRDEIQSPTARLLLEGARLIDESRR